MLQLDPLGGAAREINTSIPFGGQCLGIGGGASIERNMASIRANTVFMPGRCVDSVAGLRAK
jgi:hypothetical protein